MRACVHLLLKIRMWFIHLRQNWSWYSFVIASDMLCISQTKKGTSPIWMCFYHLISLMCFSVHFLFVLFLISTNCNVMKSFVEFSLNFFQFRLLFRFVIVYIDKPFSFVVFHSICTFVTCSCFIWSFSYCAGTVVVFRCYRFFEVLPSYQIHYMCKFK